MSVCGVVRVNPSAPPRTSHPAIGTARAARAAMITSTTTAASSTAPTATAATEETIPILFFPVPAPSLVPAPARRPGARTEAILHLRALAAATETESVLNTARRRAVRAPSAALVVAPITPGAPTTMPTRWAAAATRAPRRRRARWYPSRRTSVVVPMNRTTNITVLSSITTAT